MTDNWPACIAFTLQAEGGFVIDDGGATNHGVTISTLSDWLGHSATVKDVKCLTETQAQAIYRANYWDVVNGDDLPAGVDLVVFDFGVNAGPRHSLIQMQRAIGVRADGVFGPITMAAIREKYASNQRDVIDTISRRQEGYYRSLSNFHLYGHGWLDRLDRRETLAKAMARKANP